MTAFNFFSHGTQDIYPTFLQVQHRLTPHAVGIIAVIYNIGAICGGILFGTLSERFGRRRCIIIAALLSLPVMPLWAFSPAPTLLAIGAFLMQFVVQGAWGVVPVHLNELSPDDARGTFPGFVYQLGNLLASVNATLQAGIAAHYGGNYGLALAVVAGTVAVVIAVPDGPRHRGQGRRVRAARSSRPSFRQGSRSMPTSRARADTGRAAAASPSDRADPLRGGRAASGRGSGRRHSSCRGRGR